MCIHTTPNFAYFNVFTKEPCDSIFLYKLNIAAFVEPDLYTIREDERLFDNPVLLPKLLMMCLFKHIELLIKDPVCHTKIKSFLSHFDKFNPIVRDREILIFLSLILNRKDFSIAVLDYFQVEKRCAIRDYWQWVVFEDYNVNTKGEGIYFEPTALLSFFTLGNLFPYFYRDPSCHPLEDYGFHPKDGIWKRLDYHHTPCQEGDLALNYNYRTCAITKIDPTYCIYKYLNKEGELSRQFKEGTLLTDSSKALFLAAIPPVLSTILIRCYMHIFEFVIGPKHFTEDNYTVGLSPEAQAVILRLLEHEDKDQKESFLMFLKAYNPLKTDFEPISESEPYFGYRL